METYLIIDLEATCCNQNTVPRKEMEIIEIGAVAVESAHFEIIGEYSTFIKPVRHPRLTEFCSQLTSITQEQVQSAPLFGVAIKKFCDWFYSFEEPHFCSWGDYDQNQLRQDCYYHRIPYPLPEAHTNIKKKFSEVQGLHKSYGMKGALFKAGLELEGTHHRGIDDAKNMARLLPYIFGEMKIPPYQKIKRAEK